MNILFFPDKLQHCGVSSCPFRGEVQFSCGPSCGQTKKTTTDAINVPFVSAKTCQCRVKSPLSFRTCICPGYECPRIENDIPWPCPCPFPPDELDPSYQDPKQLAAERSRMTENTSGFKVAIEKKKPAFEGEMSFDEAVKFFAEHPECLPPIITASSQTLLIPDEHHSDCCCEDRETIHDLTTCPGDAPFVSDRHKKSRKKGKKDKKDKHKDKKSKRDRKHKKDKKNKSAKSEVGDQTSNTSSSSSSSSASSWEKDKNKYSKAACLRPQWAAPGEEEMTSSSSESASSDLQKLPAKPLKDHLTFTILGKGSASPGLSGLCCYDFITENSPEIDTYLMLSPSTDWSTSSDSTTYLLYTWNYCAQYFVFYVIHFYFGCSDSCPKILRDFSFWP